MDPRPTGVTFPFFLFFGTYCTSKPFFVLLGDVKITGSGTLCIPGQVCLLSRYSLVLTCVACLETEEQLYPFRARRRLRPRSCLSGKPLVSHLRYSYAFQVLQIRSQCLRHANGNPKFKSFFKYITLRKQLKKLSYRPCGKKREKMFVIFSFFPPNGCRRRNLFFLVANCQHGDRNQLV